MKIEQIYTGCLAEAAYYIESEGEVAIIDPLREPHPYLERAQRDNAQIKYVLETHFHADFVSGHVELAQKSGAKIIYGPHAHCSFDCHIAHDGEEFKVGALTIRVLHTPGHTLESTTYLLLDENGKEHCIFTGDTLFINDVGRPDLTVKSDLSLADLAGYLYQSLHTKILPLPDEVIVYPAHGAGSACGKNMAKETYDTLGHQKQVNYALQAMSQADFVQSVTEGLAAAPPYFPFNAAMNSQTVKSLDGIIERGMNALGADDFERLAAKTEACILDTRPAKLFAQGFIPGSVHIGLDGQFAPWVGALINDLQRPILLVCDSGREVECITRLARVGYDNTIGYLKGGVEIWKAAGKNLADIENITCSEFEEKYYGSGVSLIDVRKPSEYVAEHLEGAVNLPLSDIHQWIDKLDHQQVHYLHCAGGYRSMIAASVLHAKGYPHLVNLAGGYGALCQTKLPRVKETNELFI